MSLHFKKIDKDQLLQSSLQHFENALLLSFTNVIDKTRQHLIKELNHCDLANDQLFLKNDYDYLKNNQSNLISLLSKSVKQMPKKYIHVLEKSKFEMPETIDLEVEFNYKQLEKLIHDNFSICYSVLEKRLKVLLSNSSITKTNMPFSTKATSSIFKNLFKQTSLSSTTQSKMISLLANELLITLNQALKSIDKLFIDAKILPNISKISGKENNELNCFVKKAQ